MVDEVILSRYLDGDGRLRVMPSKKAARAVVLRHCARLIPTGTELPEIQVNRCLMPVSDDVAMLRRYLVEAGLIRRRPPGIYWREDETPHE